MEYCFGNMRETNYIILSSRVHTTPTSDLLEKRVKEIISF
jgi:hypothetical protein